MNRQTGISAVFLGLLILAGGFYYTRHESRTMRNEKEKWLIGVAELKIEQLAAWRRKRLADVRVFSERKMFVRRVARWLSEPESRSLKEDILYELAVPQNAYAYESVFLASPEGRVLLYSGIQRKDLGPLTIQKIQEAVQSRKVMLTDFYRCTLDRDIHWDAIVPLTDGDGPIQAVLILRMNPQDNLFPIIQAWPEARWTSETLILRKEGDHILFLNKPRHLNAAPLSVRIPLGGEQRPFVEAVLGHSGIWEGTDYRGERVIAYMNRVPDTDWVMVSKVDRSELLHELYTHVGYNILITALILLLFGACFLAYANRRRSRIYKQLCRSQEKFQAMLYSIGDGVITADKEGRVQNMNPAAETMTGWKEDQALGKPVETVLRLVGEDAPAGMENLAQTVLENGMPVQSGDHTFLISRQGSEIPVAVSGAPVRSGKGKTAGAVIVFKDRTGERASRRELEEARAFAENLIETANVMIVGLDSKGRITLFNRATQEITGYRMKELKGISWFETLVPVRQYPHVQAEFNRLVKKGVPGQFENPILTKDDEERMIQWRNSQVMNDAQQVIGTVSFGLDITEIRNAEKRTECLNAMLMAVRDIDRLIVHSKDLDSLLQGVCDTLVKIRSYTGCGIFLFKEKENFFAQAAGAGRFCIGTEWQVDRKGKGNAPECVRECIRSGQAQVYESEQCGQCPSFGSAESWTVFLVPINSGNTVAGLMQVCESKEVEIYQEERQWLEEVADDIGFAILKHQTDEALKRSEKQYRSLFEETPIGIFRTNSRGQILHLNSAMAKIVGCRNPREALSKYRNLARDLYVDPRRREKFIEILREHGEVNDFEYEAIKADETHIWLSMNARISEKHVDGSFLIDGFIKDITGRKRVEQALSESENKHRTLFETMSQGVVYQAASGEIVSANPAAERILGLSLDQMRGRKSRDPRWKAVREDGSDYPGDDHPSMTALREAREVRNAVMGVFNPKRNSLVWINTNAIPLFRANEKKPYRVYTTFEDITERKQAEEQVRRDLRIKEAMLKEIHHRVKNNLTVISSLLNLQAGQIRNKKGAIDAFQESRNRIRSMALVHEKLYESEDFSEINMKSYIESMALELFLAYQAEAQIRLNLNINDISLDINTAIPCGLILNELITNSLKHAFRGRKTGAIDILFNRKDINRCELIVRDNGSGIPESVKVEHSGTLGLKLIHILAEQIEGTISLYRKKGTRFQIQFRCSPDREK
ncbi:MAG TPA: PAS domain S-box protein [bacterium]|nr:PAS domain S-box protein [bacterium]